jgi:hypothetical protein
MFDKYTDGFNAGFDFAHTGPALKKLEAEAEERGFRRAVTDREYLRIHRQRMEMILDQIEDQTFDVVLKAFSEFGLFNAENKTDDRLPKLYSIKAHEWLRVNRDKILSSGLPIRGDLVKNGGAE